MPPRIAAWHGHISMRRQVHEDVVVRQCSNASFLALNHRVWLGAIAMLLNAADVAGLAGLALLAHQLLDFGKKVRIIADQISHHRMLRRKLDRGSAVNGIDARGEYRDLVATGTGKAIDLEVDRCAFTAANPVTLHHPDSLRPSFKLFKVTQQFF